MRQPFDRRTFLRGALGGVVLGNLQVRGLRCHAGSTQEQTTFRISLAQWSLHRALRGGELDNLDFAKTTREAFDIGAIEYVNQFFKDKAHDEKYLNELNKRATDYDVKQLLIMCDGEGRLGDPDPEKREQAVKNHHKWVDAALALGCHSIRVNAASGGTYEEQLERAAEGLTALTEYGAKHQIHVIVENHGGLSSNGEWLAAVIQRVDSKWCGTLPDFGNFGDYDRYKGVKELMPFAKGVSAKSHDFNDDGSETRTDYYRMMKIVLEADYHNWVGIEYEGSKLDEYAGIRATKRLLQRVRAELS